MSDRIHNFLNKINMALWCLVNSITMKEVGYFDIISAMQILVLKLTKDLANKDSNYRIYLESET